MRAIPGIPHDRIRKHKNCSLQDMARRIGKYVIQKTLGEGSLGKWALRVDWTYE